MMSTPSLPGAARVRSQKATRALIAVYFAGLIVAVTLFILSLATSMSTTVFLLLYVSALFVSMAAWTYIRGANGRKDRLPDSELDEYERDIFATWRKHAFRAFSALTMIGGFGFCGYAVFVGGSEDGTEVAVAGLYMLFTYLFVATLPMIGFAATINRDHPEDHAEEE